MSELQHLKEVVEKLRAEDGGPWDRAQTHMSLKAACIEEAAEVVAGINILEVDVSSLVIYFSIAALLFAI